mgnify:CR=1 FL=1
MDGQGHLKALGEQIFDLRAALTFEPDGAASGFALGPRVLVHIDGLANAGLISEGTLFETQYRMKISPRTGLEELEWAAKEAFRDDGAHSCRNANATHGHACKAYKN